MAKISVCIATYNGEKYIKAQIHSILEQLGKSDEVIISDDLSTDNTLNIVREINDSRIKLIPSTKFHSPSKNFENALKVAEGDIVFLADQDDFWLPGKVEKMCESLGSYDLVVSNCYIGNQNLEIIRESYFDWRSSRKGLVKNVLRNSYLGCCMAFHRYVLNKALPFPPNIPMHDMWLGVIAEVFYKPFFLSEQLMIYRRHSENATPLSEDFKSQESFASQISFRLNLLKALILRVAELNFR